MRARRSSRQAVAAVERLPRCGRTVRNVVEDCTKLYEFGFVPLYCPYDDDALMHLLCSIWPTLAVKLWIWTRIIPCRIPILLIGHELLKYYSGKFQVTSVGHLCVCLCGCVFSPNAMCKWSLLMWLPICNYIFSAPPASATNLSVLLNYY